MGQREQDESGGSLGHVQDLASALSLHPVSLALLFCAQAQQRAG